MMALDVDSINLSLLGADDVIEAHARWFHVKADRDLDVFTKFTAITNTSAEDLSVLTRDRASCL